MTFSVYLIHVYNELLWIYVGSHSMFFCSISNLNILFWKDYVFQDFYKRCWVDDTEVKWIEKFWLFIYFYNSIDWLDYEIWKWVSWCTPSAQWNVTTKCYSFFFTENTHKNSHWSCFVSVFSQHNVIRN